jgi:hypothetical protein
VRLQHDQDHDCQFCGGGTNYTDPKLGGPVCVTCLALYNAIYNEVGRTVAKQLLENIRRQKGEA